MIFIDVKTGVNYAISYITSGASETIKLEKGIWRESDVNIYQDSKKI